MPLSILQFRDWLQSLQPNPPAQQWPPFFTGPYIRDMPDQIVTVSLLPGIGFVMEGTADSPNVQIRTRSAQNDQQSAEDVAFAIDQAIFNTHFPVIFEDTTFVLVTRAGGSPVPLGPPDDAFRYDYVCTYRCVIGV